MDKVLVIVYSWSYECVWSLERIIQDSDLVRVVLHVGLWKR